MMLDREQIETALRQKNCAYKLCCLEQTDSTNADARRAAVQGAEHGLVITAETQSAGRGRRGRSWVSPAGENLYFSLLLFPEFAQEKAQMLTLTAALAVAQAIREYGIDARIKWPNDVVADGRKLCGILTELCATDTGFAVICGAGVNCLQQPDDFPPEVAVMATSVAQLGGNPDRAGLAAAMIRQLHQAAVDMLQPKDWMDSYRSHCITLGQDVQLLRDGQTRMAHADGMDDRGALLVTLADGTKETVFSGEVSVRGMYGYL